MRHRKAGKQLGRNSSHRRALLRNMVTSLLKHDEIVTTDVKAKQIRPIAEKMITLGKRGDLHARRQALSYLQNKTVAHKVFEDLKERFLDRQGGYVRIVKKGERKGDGALLSVVQLIPPEEGKKSGKAKKKRSKSTAAKKLDASKQKAKAPKKEKEETGGEAAKE